MNTFFDYRSWSFPFHQLYCLKTCCCVFSSVGLLHTVCLLLWVSPMCASFYLQMKMVNVYFSFLAALSLKKHYQARPPFKREFVVDGCLPFHCSHEQRKCVHCESGSYPILWHVLCTLTISIVTLQEICSIQTIVVSDGVHAQDETSNFQLSKLFSRFALQRVYFTAIIMNKSYQKWLEPGICSSKYLAHSAWNSVASGSSHVQ